jgi:hypothetical protein
LKKCPPKIPAFTVGGRSFCGIAFIELILTEKFYETIDEYRWTRINKKDGEIL